MQLKRDLLSTLAYFDLFDYPITGIELYSYLQTSCSYEEFQSVLKVLSSENQVFRLEDFYSLRNDFRLASRRKKGNLRARQLLKTADRIAGFLACFPFVKGVAVSGSLSKNFADEHADIDFFLITEKNKLWIARTFMHVFKKLTFLVRKQHWFCMNYYVSEEGLEIREKNYYTAIEIATLMPLRGSAIFRDFYAQNQWSRMVLPNHSMKVSHTREISKSFLKVLLEFPFRGPTGEL
ncbi:MAG TPA: hypothetical protein VHK91_17435, partial [Flavisolibacter sp.]|nr:hypothetical protein [Flavisolibacter sp.]